MNLQLAAALPKISITPVNFFTVQFGHQRRSRTNGISKFSVRSWSLTLAVFSSNPGVTAENFLTHLLGRKCYQSDRKRPYVTVDSDIDWTRRIRKVELKFEDFIVT